MAATNRDPDQRPGRWPSSTFFFVLLSGLLAAVAILVVLWAIA